MTSLIMPSAPSGRCPAGLLSGAGRSGQAEYAGLSPPEVSLCTEAAKPSAARVADLDGALVASLYRRGLLYFNVPIWPDDHVSIPPLEASRAGTAVGAAAGSSWPV